MLIDWFTVTAQIINFLILVYLLKRFLYGPIIKAMDKREERIAARLKEAGEKAEKADMEAATYQSMKAELEQAREKMMEGARAEAEEKRRELLDQARREVDSVREIWEEDLERDKEAFLRQLRQRTADRVMLICRKAFRDIANTEFERQVIEAFLDRARRMDGDDRAAFAETLRGKSGVVVVTSRFDIPEQSQEKVAGQLREILEGAAAVKFERSPDVICGIEMESDGRKISWSLDSYLDGLEDEIHRTISEKGARRV